MEVLLIDLGLLKVRMLKGMGSAKFDELMNWLMETLKSEGSSVDRSGAAQGKNVEGNG